MREQEACLQYLDPGDSLSTVLALLYDSLIRVSLEAEDHDPVYIRPEMQQSELLSGLRNELLRGRRPQPLTESQRSNFLLSFGTRNSGLLGGGREISLRLAQTECQRERDAIVLVPLEKAGPEMDEALSRLLRSQLRDPGHAVRFLVHSGPSSLGSTNSPSQESVHNKDASDFARSTMKDALPKALAILETTKKARYEFYLSALELDENGAPKVNYDARGAGSPSYSRQEYTRLIRDLLSD
jgi:hypothetical protein